MRRGQIMSALAVALVALACAAQAQAATTQGWTKAIGGHSGKLGPQFAQRLRYAQADGALRVMVTTRSRSAAVERLVRRSTEWVRWYGARPAFFAAVRPDGLAALLDARAVRYVEADYPIKYSLSISARDVLARGRDVVAPGTPSGDAIVSAASPTTTWEGDAPGIAEQLVNIFAPFAGAKRVCTATLCHSFRLGVADRGTLTIVTKAPEAGDIVDLEIIAPDGSVTFRSGTSGNAPAVVKDAAPGAYTVNTWVDTPLGQGIPGHFTATATLGPASSVPEAMWSLDRSSSGLGTFKSAVPGLTADQATGKGVTVALIDSGIDKTHPDFAGRVKRAVSVDQIAGLGIDPGDQMPTTDLAGGHGTHVAGIVAGDGVMARRAADESSTLRAPVGLPIGIAPQASLVSIKSGEALAASFAPDALGWLADHAKELGVKVANNSWGCGGGCAFDPRSAIALVLRDLYRAGVLTVFSVGNDGGDASGTSLSGFAQSPYVLGVANYDAVTHDLAADSSRGSADAALPAPATWTPESEPEGGLRRPDIAAPGMNIWSTKSLTGGAVTLTPRVDTDDAPGAPVTDGTGGYVALSGTSMSAPHVTGAAAVLFSACPNARVLDVMRAIMASADPERVRATDGSAVAQPFEVGYGGLAVRPALDWLRANTTAC